MKNYFVLTASIICVIASLIWGYVDGGFEPWIAALGGAIGIALNSESIPVFGKPKRHQSPEEKIAARDKWRPIFENYFLENSQSGRLGDAIIHDVDRLDAYPSTEDKKEKEGISSWFRAGLMGTYHKGILIGLRWTYIEERDGVWTKTTESESPTATKAILLGEAPYECIESVNFDEDNYYNKPHIYCHFDFQGEPYERLYYGEKFQLDTRSPYYYAEISEYSVKPNSRWKIRWWLPQVRKMAVTLRENLKR